MPHYNNREAIAWHTQLQSALSTTEDMPTLLLCAVPAICKGWKLAHCFIHWYHYIIKRYIEQQKNPSVDCLHNNCMLFNTSGTSKNILFIVQW